MVRHTSCAATKKPPIEVGGPGEGPKHIRKKQRQKIDVQQAETEAPIMATEINPG